MLLKIIKTFVEDNIDRSVTSQAVHSNYESITWLDGVHFSLNKNTDFSTVESIREIFLTHRANFKESLRVIARKTDFNLKDVSTSTQSLYKPNLTTLIAEGDDNKARYNYLLEVCPSLKDYDTYKKTPESFDRLSNSEVLEVQKLKDLPDFSCIVNKLHSDKLDIQGLHTYISDSSLEVRHCINTSNNYLHNITSSPDYPNFIDLVLTMLDPLTLQETLNLCEFIKIQPKLSFLLMNPALVSVLGNALFFKFLFPLITSSSIKGGLYNWAKVREDIESKVYHRKRLQHTYRSLKKTYMYLYDNRNTISALAGCVFPAIRIYDFLYSRSPSIIPNSEPERITYRQMLDRVPQGDGLEQYGLNLNPARRVLAAVCTEVARTAGSISDGLIRGSIDRTRPIAEQIADAADRRK
jgi:hypothetical protein